MTEDRLRDLLRRSHDVDAPPPGFATTVRAARAAGEAPPRRTHRLVAAALATALAVAAWLASRDRDPPAPALVAPSLEVAGPFDQLPSPFPGLALADLEDPW